MHKLEYVDNKPETVGFNDMKQGEIMEITVSPYTRYMGLLVMRAYGDRWVDLSNGTTWDKYAESIRGKLLSKGTKITLTVGGE